jgi:hypothetical protein
MRNVFTQAFALWRVSEDHWGDLRKYTHTFKCLQQTRKTLRVSFGLSGQFIDMKRLLGH